jgi:hypothetical protein
VTLATGYSHVNVRIFLPKPLRFAAMTCLAYKNNIFCGQEISACTIKGRKRAVSGEKIQHFWIRWADLDADCRFLDRCIRSLCLAGQTQDLT